MKYMLIKDKKRRILYTFFERRRKVLKSLLENFQLAKPFRSYVYKQLTSLPRNASITRIRNRCTLTNRSRAIYKKFGLSRLMFRKYAWQGNLVGIKKASW